MTAHTLQNLQNWKKSGFANLYIRLSITPVHGLSNLSFFLFLFSFTYLTVTSRNFPVVGQIKFYCIMS